MSLVSTRRKATVAAAFLSLFLIASQAFASLDLPFVLEVRQTGSGSADTNAGGFVWGASIAAPAIPTVTASGSGGTVAAATYYVVITYTDAWGDTVISPQQSVTTSGATASFTVTSPSSATDAVNWNCYVGTVSGGPYFPQGTALTIGSNRVVTATPPTTGTQPRGVDYSLQDSPQINVADGVANGTTTFTSATAAFTGAHVGNLLRCGATTWRHIVGVTNATTVVLDATVTTNTSLPVVVGGAFATHGITGAVGLTHRSKVFIKYSATIYQFSASSNASGGFPTYGVIVSVIGYNTNRTQFNTDANRPSFKPNANSATFINENTNSCNYHNLIVTNPDAKTGFTIFNNMGGQEVISRCRLSGGGGTSSNLFASNGSDQHFQYCEIDNLTTGPTFTTGSTLFWCDYHDMPGCTLGARATVAFCNFYNYTGSTARFILCNNTGSVIMSCNFYHAVPVGVFHAIGLYPNCSVVNCVFEDINPTLASAGYLFDAQSTGFFPFSYVWVSNCFYFNVKTAVNDPATVTTANLFGMTALTASPFTAPGSGNFAPNNTTGGGAVIRGVSLPTTFPAGTTTNALDAGAVQSQSTTGGGKKVGPGGGKLGLIGPAIRLRKAG